MITPYTLDDRLLTVNTKTVMSSSAGPVPPTEKDIFRYRYQHGTNLGAIFVLEKWLKGSMYEKGAEGSSELAAIKRFVVLPSNKLLSPYCPPGLTAGKLPQSFGARGYQSKVGETLAHGIDG